MNWNFWLKDLLIGTTPEYMTELILLFYDHYCMRIFVNFDLIWTFAGSPLDSGRTPELMTLFILSVYGNYFKIKIYNDYFIRISVNLWSYLKWTFAEGSLDGQDTKTSDST